jgi:hypothetical protein
MARGTRAKLGSSEAKVTLVNQVRDQISRYLGADISLHELRVWLSMPENVQGTANSTDETVQDLSDRVLILASEFDYGHRSEREVRQALKLTLEEKIEAS